MLLKLAWRNIFRNKRRSLITISSIVFAVVFAVFMRSLQFGAYGNMLKNIVGSYMGYIQVHQQGFWAEKTLDNSFSNSDIDHLLELDEVSYLSQRIEGFALASKDDNSKPVAILGLDALQEKDNIHLDDKLVEGNYIGGNSNGILVAKGLKKIMSLNLGDSLVFLGQGYQGSIASGSYPINGFIDLKTPELNKRTVVMNLVDAQDFFGMSVMITTSVVGINGDDWQAAQKAVIQAVDTSQLEILSWEEMLPEIVQLIIVDKAGGTFVLLILYSIITFSLFGTVLMLTEERSFEYGVLTAIGMAKSKVVYVAILETILMAITGVLIGLVVVFPILIYFNVHPINLSGQMQEVVEKFGFEALIPTSLDPSIALTHASIIFIIVLIVNIYTIVRIKNLEPVKAMRR
ncbi:FtsX-like permease family protein [Bacteroidia bacterium]|nr:FtsX-like permease family protein [Bacteroidia bacterium]MDB4107470.1 FtsX-like permease family protein [Bacteroidia bacterium]MDB9881643.1 FtsX-like permease family protein [Bacteroidia bacterium]